MRFLVEIDLERQVARVQRAIRVREDLLAFVSHDLKGPVASISLSAAVVREALVAPSSENPLLRAQEAAERILRAAGRMNKLIADLLDAASIEAGHFSIRPRAEPIDNIISESVALAITVWYGPIATACSRSS
jgi:signal transduction histidine kinase